MKKTFFVLFLLYFASIFDTIASDNLNKYIDKVDQDGYEIFKNKKDISYTIVYKNKNIPVQFNFAQLKHYITIDIKIDDSICIDKYSKVKFSLNENEECLINISNENKICNGVLTLDFNYEVDRDLITKIILSGEINKVSLIIDGKTYELIDDNNTNGDLLYLIMQFYSIYLNG